MQTRAKIQKYFWVVTALFLLPAITLAQGKFESPLGNNATVDGVLVKIINFLLGLVGLLALLSIIVGGIRIIAAFGKEDAVTQGKKIIFWAIIGLVVVSLAWVIINLVTNQFLGAG